MTKIKHKIKIREKTPEYLIESIENRLNHFEGKPSDLKKEYEKKIAEAKKEVKKNKQFWEKNKLPIYDWKAACDRRDSISNRALYVTKTFWKTWDALNINTWEKHSGHACVHCGKEPINRELCFSDSRYDENFQCCDCEGARKNGKRWTEVNGND